MPASPKHATVGLVLSLTLASSLHPDVDLHRRLTLPLINCIGAGSTCTATIIREAFIQETAVDPLDALLNQVHSQISAETWSKMPKTFADDVDKLVYGA
jgi:hypothetical protein